MGRRKFRVRNDLRRMVRFVSKSENFYFSSLIDVNGYRN